MNQGKMVQSGHHNFFPHTRGDQLLGDIVKTLEELKAVIAAIDNQPSVSPHKEALSTSRERLSEAREELEAARSIVKASEHVEKDKYIEYAKAYTAVARPILKDIVDQWNTTNVDPKIVRVLVVEDGLIWERLAFVRGMISSSIYLCRMDKAYIDDDGKINLTRDYNCTATRMTGYVCSSMVIHTDDLVMINELYDENGDRKDDTVGDQRKTDRH